jgi:Phage integrase family
VVIAVGQSGPVVSTLPKMANDGQDTRAIQHYLGHKNIAHTTRYTNLASDRFKIKCTYRLLALGEVPKGEVAVAVAEEREEAKQVEQEGDHRTGSSPGQSRQINHLPAGRSFGRNTPRFDYRSSWPLTARA